MNAIGGISFVRRKREGRRQPVVFQGLDKWVIAPGVQYFHCMALPTADLPVLRAGKAMLRQFMLTSAANSNPKHTLKVRFCKTARDLNPDQAAGRRQWTRRRVPAICKVVGLVIWSTTLNSSCNKALSAFVQEILDGLVVGLWPRIIVS